jgi:hypothetical protein
VPGRRGGRSSGLEMSSRVRRAGEAYSAASPRRA